MIEMDMGEKTEERAGRNQRRLHRGGDIFFQGLEECAGVGQREKKSIMYVSIIYSLLCNKLCQNVTT